MKEKKLTERQKRFCEEYIIDLNAKAAAIRAGYSEKTAKVIGCENLTKPNLEKYIAELKTEVIERNNISIDKYVRILDNLASFDMADVFDKNGNIKSIHEIPEEARMAIEGLDSQEMILDGQSLGFSKKIKMTSRRAAIDLLLKHLGGYERDNEQQKTNNIVLVKIPDNGRSSDH